jgi:hypothetical protein
MSRSHGHNAAGRIRSIEKSYNFIANRTRDLPARSIVPQPTTLPRAPTFAWYVFIICYYLCLGLLICRHLRFFPAKFWIHFLFPSNVLHFLPIYLIILLLLFSFTGATTLCEPWRLPWFRNSKFVRGGVVSFTPNPPTWRTRDYVSSGP